MEEQPPSVAGCGEGGLTMPEYIGREAVLEALRDAAKYYSHIDDCTEHTILQCMSTIQNIPAADVVEVVALKAYLQKCLDEWHALGDRKYEPTNMWGYNFIMKCFDDLERRNDDAGSKID